MSTLPADLNPRRLLIIKPSAVGDVVHTLPILARLRKRWPIAEIDWLITPACAGIIQGHPMLSQVILFDRKGMSRWWMNPSHLRALWNLKKQLRSRQYDLVIDLQGLLRSGYLAKATGAPIRVGLANAREMAWIFYTHRVNTGTAEQHAIDRYLAVARYLGCAEGPVEYPFATDDADRAAVRELIGPGKPYALLVPGTNWPTKRWPIEYFAAIVQPLADEFGLRSVVGGGPAEVALGDAIPGALNLCGKTSLRQMTALIESAALVIANDSGPMHIAAALGRPMVTVFGPTNPIRTGPYQRPGTVLSLNIACSPCYSRSCSHQSCLRWMEPERVLTHARLQLQSS